MTTSGGGEKGEAAMSTEDGGREKGTQLVIEFGVW